MARLGRPPTPVDIDMIRSLTGQGWRMRPIAEKLGVSVAVIESAMKRHGIQRHPVGSNPGALNPAWRGGRTIDPDGYVLVWIPSHPHASRHGYVREHRLVMEKHLGRYLTKKEVVHHIDDDKQHNVIENLECFEHNAEHLRITLKGKIPEWTPDGRQRIRNAPRQVRLASEETKRKMSASQKRRGAHGPFSPDTIEKIRQSAIRRAAQKRIASQLASGDDDAW